MAVDATVGRGNVRHVFPRRGRAIVAACARTNCLRMLETDRAFPTRSGVTFLAHVSAGNVIGRFARCDYTMTRTASVNDIGMINGGQAKCGG